MFDRIFANYLVDSGKLTAENLRDIFSSQEQKRVRLGVIAVSEKLMTIEQAEEVNQLQSVYDKRFGDIAVDKGYLTAEQVSRLLALQGNSFLAFVQSVIDSNYLNMGEIESELNRYQKDNNFTLMNMEDLKSCDINRIINIFVYQQPSILQSLCGVMVRTVARLVDYHVYIKSPYEIKELPYQFLSMQELNGQHKILTAISGSSDAMKEAAIGFAGEQYIENEEDALDALCELVNCVNGLLATEMGTKNIELDMEVPHYYLEKGTLRANSLFCLPVMIRGLEVDMIMAIDQEYSL